MDLSEKRTPIIFYSNTQIQQYMYFQVYMAKPVLQVCSNYIHCKYAAIYSQYTLLVASPAAASSHHFLSLPPGSQTPLSGPTRHNDDENRSMSHILPTQSRQGQKKLSFSSPKSKTPGFLGPRKAVEKEKMDLTGIVPTRGRVLKSRSSCSTLSSSSSFVATTIIIITITIPMIRLNQCDVNMQHKSLFAGQIPITATNRPYSYDALLISKHCSNIKGVQNL